MLLSASKLKRSFNSQRSSAGRREIPFLLTYAEWLVIWQKSKRLNQRGRCLGQYVMARPGDKGPYAIGNVHIIRCEANHRAAAPKMQGIKKTEEHKRNLSLACLGRPVSPETRRKIGLAHKGKKKGPMSDETKARLSAALKGRKPPKLSAEAIERIRQAKRLYWANYRRNF